MRSLALANQKGGVGKTTTAVHLAHGIALAGLSSVVFDLDPQGNATLAVQGMLSSDGVDRDEESAADPFSALYRLRDGFWMLPSPGATRNLERDAAPDVVELANLAASLDRAGIDWLLVDCPPRMDAWGWAGVQLCEQVLLPVQAEFFAMHGLSQMLRTLETARTRFPDRAGLFGVLATMVDGREEITREVLDDLGRNLGDRLLRAVIFRDSQFVEAASHGRTLFDYNLRSKGARAYGELVREVLYGRA